MNTRSTSAIIIGGGIIGCTIAWELRRGGIRCTLVDKGALNQEASTAAAGMLGAQVETHQPGAFYELCRLSQQLYRNWSEEIHQISAISPQYIAQGILRAALHSDDEQELKSRLPWIQNAEWLDTSEMLAMEPGISPTFWVVFALRRTIKFIPYSSPKRCKQPFISFAAKFVNGHLYLACWNGRVASKGCEQPRAPYTPIMSSYAREPGDHP